MEGSAALALYPLAVDPASRLFKVFFMKRSPSAPFEGAEG